MRYLGMSLGMGVALGYCAAFGTLIPPIFKSFLPQIPVAQSIGQIAASTPGRVTLFGVAVCLMGIAIAAMAGLTKEREMPAAEKKKTIAEFSFAKGLVVATFSGIMSACFAFALTAGAPINQAAQAAGTTPVFAGLPRLIVVLLGGFTTNLIWCLILNVKNGTGCQYFHSEICEDSPALENERIIETAIDAPSKEVTIQTMTNRRTEVQRAPMLNNYFFSALAGGTWYMQFFFYSMGESKMGKFGFASWTLHMASIIIFSTLWGIALKEWKGAGLRTKWLVGLSLLVLVTSTVVVGYGNYLGSGSSAVRSSSP